ncbi:MAG: cytochrome c [Candidatus Acidiferrum sp.]
MKKLLFACALVSALLVAGFTRAQQNSNTPQQSAKSKAAATSTSSTESDEGEKRFKLQCGRCHVAPESLSPREVRAVVRQMRVRANLTAEDERLILKYLAP